MTCSRTSRRWSGFELKDSWPIDDQGNRRGERYLAANYLVQIGQVELLPKLFHRIVIPGAVRNELLDGRAPIAVRRWMEATPIWLNAIDLLASVDPELSHLGAGESEAISMMTEVNADVILIDERMGREAAARRELKVHGTLGNSARCS